MSTKSSIILTKDNEHWYEEFSQIDPVTGDPEIILEFDKKNIEIDTDNNNDLILILKPGCELYQIIKRIRQ